MRATTTVSVAVCAAIATAGLAGAGATAISHIRSHGTSGADLVATVTTLRPEVMSATSDDLQAVLSDDYRHVDKDFAAGDAALTPTFRQEYDKLVHKALRNQVLKSHAITTAEVTAISTVSVAADRATLLAFVSQVSTNNQLTQPRIDRSRLVVTVAKQDGKWLIDRIDTV